MNNSLSMYVIQEGASILSALQSINENTKGFLIVNNEVNKVVGVLTDGDIRRAFIAGATTNDSINDFAVRKFTSLSIKNDLSDAIDIFKNLICCFVSPICVLLSINFNL